MAMPRLSSGHMKNILIRMAAVKAATQAVPSALLALWSMMLPMAVMENCSPIGTPMVSSVRARRGLYCRSSRDLGWRISKWRIM